jgi:hypothetical protein
VIIVCCVCCAWPAPSSSRAHDEWQVSDRRDLSEGSIAALVTHRHQEVVAQPELIPA